MDQRAPTPSNKQFNLDDSDSSDDDDDDSSYGESDSYYDESSDSSDDDDDDDGDNTDDSRGVVFIHGKRVNINSILSDALNDPSLKLFDVNELLERSSEHRYLSKTMNEIAKEVYDVICENITDKELSAKICKEMFGYRYVSDICDFRPGRATKAIRLEGLDCSRRKRYYGLGLSLKFTKTGTYVGCMHHGKRKSYFLYKFDDYLTFQRLNNKDSMIISANEYIKRMDSNK